MCVVTHDSDSSVEARIDLSTATHTGYTSRGGA